MKTKSSVKLVRSLCGGVLALSLSACTGNIDSSNAASGDTSSPKPGAKGGGSSAQGGGAGASVPADVTAISELRRLTRAEYTNTVYDLLGVDLSADDRPRELVIQGHSEIAAGQKTGYEDSSQYLNLGDKVATSSAAKIDADMKCSAAPCYRTWATAFLLRAFREPPTSAVVDRYMAMLSAPAAGATQVERVASFLNAVLVSPHFLYRKELGTTAVSGDATSKNINAYHVASRLSYLVWQSMPDATLFAAAEKKTLLDPAVRKTELERMLKDKRAQKGLRAFVADWMGLFDNNLGKKAATVLAGTPSDLAQQAARAFDLLVDEVLTTGASPRFSDLLKTDQVFANAALASVLGVAATGTDLQKVSLPSKDRVGILTNPMVIGAHSKESGASPFPMGKFVYENLLCEAIPPPPAAVPKVEDDAAMATTLRQKLESITKNQPCLSCHERIGPPGFSFLPFDPVGRFKNSDAKGRPYDTTGSLLFDGSPPMPFTSAADLSTKLAGRPEIQKCIARRMFRWAYGRFEADIDQSGLNTIESTSVASSAGVAQTLQQIVAAPNFGQVRVR